MPIRNLHDLFVRTLEKVFYVEVTAMRVLPHMLRRASNPRLKSEFSVQAQEATHRFARLERVFHSVDEDMCSNRCLGLDGILVEAEAALEADDTRIVDLALVAAGLAVEHYRITRYGALVAWAKVMGHEEAAELLQRTLDEAWAVRTVLAGFFEDRIHVGHRNDGGNRSRLPIPVSISGAGTVSLKERLATRLATEKEPKWLASES